MRSQPQEVIRSASDVHGQRIVPGAVHQRPLSGKRRSNRSSRTDGIPRRTVRRCNGRQRTGSDRVYADPLTTDLVGREHRRHGRSGPTSHDGASVGGRLQPQRLLPERRAAGGLLPDRESVAVGFEYSARVTVRTTGSPAGRALKCFDRVYLDDNIEHRYQVTNRNEDRRETYRDGWSYRLIVFDHAEANTYRCLPHEPRNGRNNLHRENLFVAEHPNRTANRTDDIRIPGYGSSRAAPTCRSPGDWALYDGYVAETGQIDIRTDGQKFGSDGISIERPAISTGSISAERTKAWS